MRSAQAQSAHSAPNELCPPTPCGHPAVDFVLFSVVVSGLIVLKDKENIEWLWDGTGSRIGQRR